MHIEVSDPELFKNDSPLEMSLLNVTDVPYHWHDNLEIIMVLEGQIRLYASVDDTFLNAGDIEILNINEVHRITGDGKNTILSLKIDSKLARELVPELNHIIFDIHFVAFYARRSESQQHFGKMICGLFLFLYGEKKDLDSEVKSMLTEILKFLMENFDIVYQALNNREMSIAERIILKERYRRVADYIFKNSSKHIGLKEIAEQENLSLYFLSREIKNLFGYGFQELMNYQRVHHAIKLLLKSDYNITEIAYECGYSAPRYLRTYFKDLSGLSPLAFRKKFREERENSVTRFNMADVPETRGMSLIKNYMSDLRHADEIMVEQIAIDVNKEPLFSFSNWVQFSPVSEPELNGRKMVDMDKASDSMQTAIIELKKILSSVELESSRSHLRLYAENGLKKPVWFIYYLLSLLGDEIIERGPDYLVCRRNRTIQFLAFNYSGNSPGIDRSERVMRVTIENLETSIQVVRYRGNESNISLYHKWLDLGSPEKISDEMITLLNRTLFPDIEFEHISKSAEFNITLPPSGIELISIHPGISRK